MRQTETDRDMQTDEREERERERERDGDRDRDRDRFSWLTPKDPTNKTKHNKNNTKRKQNKTNTTKHKTFNILSVCFALEIEYSNTTRTTTQNNNKTHNTRKTQKTTKKAAFANPLQKSIFGQIIQANSSKHVHDTISRKNARPNVRSDVRFFVILCHVHACWN